MGVRIDASPSPPVDEAGIPTRPPTCRRRLGTLTLCELAVSMDGGGLLGARLDEAAAWVAAGGFQRVALQFPDSLLGSAARYTLVLPLLTRRREVDCKWHA